MILPIQGLTSLQFLKSFSILLGLLILSFNVVAQKGKGAVPGAATPVGTGASASAGSGAKSSASTSAGGSFVWRFRSA